MDNQGITPEELEMLLAQPVHTAPSGFGARCLALWTEIICFVKRIWR